MNKCPYCHSELVRTRNQEGSQVTPKKGDYSVCSTCGQALVFANDKGVVRKITQQEEETMPDQAREVLSLTQQRIKGEARRRQV